MARLTDPRWRWLLLPGALALGGCGPIISTSMIIDAESKLAAAKAAEAEQYAPYEYTAATEYLQKAHEELGYADYGPAIDYAFKAAEAAERGTKRASTEKTKYLEAAPEAPAADAAATPGVNIKRIDVPTEQP